MKPMKWSNESLMPGFSDLIEDVFGDRFFNGWNRALTTPAVNVEETGTELKLEVAAPGMKKKDFKLTIDNGVMTVSAETKKEEATEKDNYRRREFNYRSFKRSFWLPENIETNKIEAAYEDGLLRIRLPKVVGVSANQGTTVKIQ